jgi:hypothetical protein
MPHINGKTKNGTNWRVGAESASLGSELGTIGHALALALSWKANGSILWAILHMFFGWFYVAYNLIVIRNMF